MYKKIFNYFDMIEIIFRLNLFVLIALFTVCTFFLLSKIHLYIRLILIFVIYINRDIDLFNQKKHQTSLTLNEKPKESVVKTSNLNALNKIRVNT